MHSPIIKELEKNEMHQIRQLALRIWPKSFEEILSSSQIEYMLEMMYALPILEKDFDRGVQFFILKVDENNAGFAAIEKKEKHSFKLHKIYLDQKLHGMGLGKILLKAMEQEVKNRGGIQLFLNVNRHNKAIAFYKSQGYQVINEEDIEIGNGYYMNDYVMLKQL